MAERVARLRHELTENPFEFVAAGLFALFTVVAAVGPWIAPYDALATDAAHALQAPSPAHWFGLDQLGRDVFSRVIVATRLDLLIAFGAVILGGVIGSLIGAASGYFGGGADGLVSRVVDVLMAFPLFVLAMAIVAALGDSVANVIVATAIINLPFYIRLARVEILIRRNLGYVEAARIGGSSHLRILLVFLLPNILPALVVQASLNLGWAVLNAAGLSFIGLGIRPPTAEWGVMAADGARFIGSGQWWIGLFPDLALMLAVFCFHLLGDVLRGRIDARASA